MQGNKFRTFFIKTAKTTLQEKTKTIPNYWKRRKKSKKWFDKDCKKIQTEVQKVGRKPSATQNPFEKNGKNW